MQNQLQDKITKAMFTASCRSTQTHAKEGSKRKMDF